MGYDTTVSEFITDFPYREICGAGAQTSFVRYLDIIAIYFNNVKSYDWSWLGRFEKLVR